MWFIRNTLEIESASGSVAPDGVAKEDSDEDSSLKSDCQILMFDLTPIERYSRENTL